ncbi:hypothetical protein ACFOD4_19350 [Pseudoroseomonas globiformis]|uniref:Uncharacterized protein n=1 Tax=Teichococcus globiformis TaxID=2307229 RepID=A0ABV7G3Z7_9PROT
MDVATALRTLLDQENDPESGLPHLHHVAWNAQALVEYDRRLKAGTLPASGEALTPAGGPMGVVQTVGFDRFPKQGSHLGKRVEVCFNYDTSRRLSGTIVRDDAEAPGETLIRLDDGRFVRSVECQYSVPQSANVDLST